MNIVPWFRKREDGSEDSFETAMTRFRDEMDDLFARFFGAQDFFPLARRGERAFGPRIDMAESENDVTIRAELPGIDPNDVDVQVVGNTLTLRGEKKQEREEKKRDYHYVERQYGSFHRSIPLPATVDPSKVEAGYHDGILTVTIAKRPDAKPKRIPVKSA